MKLGINGFGRKGKLTLWYHILKKRFEEIVINIGEIEIPLEMLVRFIEKDSTYGSLGSYIYGWRTPLSENFIQIDADYQVIEVDGVKIQILTTPLKPTNEIAWEQHGVEIVIDTTDRFTDPRISPDATQGSIRGHLKAGAKKVLLSSPFSLSTNKMGLPKDCITIVKGINENTAYKPLDHRIISTASCTTACLAHMIKPLLDMFSKKNILSISASAIHAATDTQSILDTLPQIVGNNERYHRSVFDNIIPTNTGAADTLPFVLPEMAGIPFMAESIRVPITTGSLAILSVNILHNNEPIDKIKINELYKEESKRGYLQYTDRQNVSGDVKGLQCAVLIEGSMSHTRTIESEKTILKEILPDYDATQINIFGWYDNEFGNDVALSGETLFYVINNGL
jgi:glyceraldehyde 3-phosphate dehydrogenase